MIKISIYCNGGRHHVGDVQSTSFWSALMMAQHFSGSNYSWRVRRVE